MAESESPCCTMYSGVVVGGGTVLAGTVVTPAAVEDGLIDAASVVAPSSGAFRPHAAKSKIAVTNANTRPAVMSTLLFDWTEYG